MKPPGIPTIVSVMSPLTSVLFTSMPFLVRLMAVGVLLPPVVLTGDPAIQHPNPMVRWGGGDVVTEVTRDQKHSEGWR